MDIVVHTGAFEEDLAKYYFVQLLAGVYQLHKQQKSHRDLKPENVCLDSEFNLKIIDFGFAASIYEDRETEGTTVFFSPGQHAGYKTNFHKDDIFTCGIILYCMLHRAQPFTMATKKEENYKPLYLGLYGKFWENAQETSEVELSDNVKQLISMMLHPNEEARPLI